MAKIAEEDRRRLLESHHNIEALPDAGALTGDDIFQRALVRSRDRLSEARGVLLEAMRHNLRESLESAAARVAVEDSARHSIAQYAYVHKSAEHTLLTVDPDTPRAATTQANNASVFSTVFTEVPSALPSMGPARLVEYLTEVSQTMSSVDALQPLGLHTRLESAVEALGPIVTAWDREQSEDRAATRALLRARARFDHEHHAHADQIRAVLRRDGDGAPSSAFILADDPAYRARRSTHQPLDAEPGISDIDTEADPQP